MPNYNISDVTTLDAIHYFLYFKFCTIGSLVEIQVTLAINGYNHSQDTGK